ASAMGKLREQTFGFSRPKLAAYPARMATRPIYYIVCFNTGEKPYPWAWELKRTGEPMGVRISERGYQSKTEAEHAGENSIKKVLGDPRSRGKTEALRTPQLAIEAVWHRMNRIGRRTISSQWPVAEPSIFVNKTSAFGGNQRAVWFE